MVCKVGKETATSRFKHIIKSILGLELKETNKKESINLEFQSQPKKEKKNVLEISKSCEGSAKEKSKSNMESPMTKGKIYLENMCAAVVFMHVGYGGKYK